MTVRIGVSGHQDRKGIDWHWTRSAVAGLLVAYKNDLVGVSCLASGADQLFANCVLEAGGRIEFVRPTENYEENFVGATLCEFLRLAALAAEIDIPERKDNEEAYYSAGKKVVDLCDFLVAIWDGKPSDGKGGTADIVQYASILNKIIIIVDPIDCYIKIANTN